MSFELIDNDQPWNLTVTAGTTSRTIRVNGTTSVSEIIGNENLLAALGTGGNMKVVDSNTGETLTGIIDSSVTEIELVAVGSTKG